MFEVESDILSEVIKCKGYHKHAPEYGERAWIAEGETVDVVYWDTGNTWCAIMDVAPKKGKGQEEVVKFYRKLKKAIRKYYAEDGCRID